MKTLFSKTKIVILSASQLIPIVGFGSMLYLHASSKYKSFSLYSHVEQKLASRNERIIMIFIAVLLFYHFVGICKIANVVGGYNADALWFLTNSQENLFTAFMDGLLDVVDFSNLFLCLGHFYYVFVYKKSSSAEK